MTHSGSGALLMALEVLCDPGSSILIPTPGFGLYKCQADARGVKTKFYKLLVSSVYCCAYPSSSLPLSLPPTLPPSHSPSLPLSLSPSLLPSLSPTLPLSLSPSLPLSHSPSLPLSLQPERGWEIDLEDLERNIDDTVSAILVNNPSNPCGSVYSRQHLLHLLQVLEKHRLPIISDDIYHGMVSILTA